MSLHDYFRNGIEVRDNEPIEVVLKKFKREVTNAGTLTELKKREFFEKPSVTKRKAKEAAIRKRGRKKGSFGDS